MKQLIAAEYTVLVDKTKKDSKMTNFLCKDSIVSITSTFMNAKECATYI
jgi:hypothetical protein